MTLKNYFNMNKKSEILINTLAEANLNNAIQIEFSTLERITILKMMEQYAKHCIIEFVQSQKNAFTIIKGEGNTIENLEFLPPNKKL